MQNLFNTLENILSQDERFVTNEGQLLRNAVFEAAMKMDEPLLKVLLNNEETRKNFFKEIEVAGNKTLVFDKIGFGWVINNKAFLPDSYTRYKNKIGLVDETGRFIANSGDVELVFPYKDCVLVGGQTKEEQKRSEIFFNKKLAPDEVDRLLAPKVMVNAKRYTKDGVEDVTSFRKDDNLIIKGNNLLAIKSLLARYEGKIKCIYIDPPYNTGNDGFGYNDKFNHSAWLTFMKNRFELGKHLLRDDGSIFVHIDHHELGYINVLMDEIFGKENKVQVISVKTASPAGYKTVNPGPIDVTEYILFYTKHRENFKFKKGYVPVGYDKNYNLVLFRDRNIKKWTFKPIKEVVINDAGFKSEKEAKIKYGKSWKVILSHLIEKYAFENADDVVSIRDPHKPTEVLKKLMQESKKVNYVLEYKKGDGSIGYIYHGGVLAFYSNKMKKIDGVMSVTELLTDFWGHISWAGIAKEGGVKLKNGKKPEKLIKQIFDIATEPNDFILDYHLGSGTTCAVAHKLGLNYIGCKQLYYGDNDAVVRLKNVINGEQTGISKSVNWQGGGSFVYCELAQLNEKYVEAVQKATIDAEVTKILQAVLATGFISDKVNPKLIDTDADDYKALSLDEKRKFVMEVLDSNMLYVNYSDIDDKEFNVSEADKAFSKSFYGEE